MIAVLNAFPTKIVPQAAAVRSGRVSYTAFSIWYPESADSQMKTGWLSIIK